ncbi:MAG: hypothetical protein LBI30_01045 [Holosporales bacterium]|jgi:hypothetical protein|nr:hypothetical protein [Holosporales bacterium]
MSRYALIGEGSFVAIHLAKLLLEQDDTEFVLSIGCSPPKSEPFNLGVGEGDPRYVYEIIDITKQQKRMFFLFCVSAGKNNLVNLRFTKQTLYL